MTIYKKQGKIIFIVAVVIFFIAMILLMQLVVGLDESQIEGRGIFDARLTYYSGDFFYETIGMMTEQNIKDYYAFHIVDNFFVVSYFLLMFILTYPLLSIKNKKFAFIVPAFPAIFDFIENTSIDLLIKAYPAQHGYADFLGIICCLKWYTGLAWFVFLLVLFVFWLVNKTRTRKIN